MSQPTREQWRELRKTAMRVPFEILGASGYPNSIRSAHKHNVRTPNGVLVHSPRDIMRRGVVHDSGVAVFVDVLWASDRVYVIWQGEPVHEIVTAIQWLADTFPERRRLVVAPGGEDADA